MTAKTIVNHEAYYNEHIRDKAMELWRLCHDAGIPMLAIFELDNGPDRRVDGAANLNEDTSDTLWSIWQLFDSATDEKDVLETLSP